MIAADTSAFVAIVRNEAEAAVFNRILASNRVLVGTPTLLEMSMVLATLLRREAADRYLERLLGDPSIEPVPFSTDMFRAARVAFETFGRGRHPAKLNFGDCMAYALAKVRGVPLLYKGNDFAKTDLRPAHLP